MHTPVLLAVESAAVAEQPTATGGVITEAAALVKASDGRYLVRLIDAGEGSSATYPPAVLEQAAKDRAFPAGTRIHLDHPSESGAQEMPGRSVKDWCAVLTEDATYNPESQALEAPIKVFRPYQVLIEDLQEYVGLSIHAWIESTPTPGKPVATRFLPSPHNTVDFVTAAGRGGKVLSALESARDASEATARDRREQLSQAVKDAYQTAPNGYVWVRDYDEDNGLVWFEDHEDRTWQQSYTVAADDLSVALTGDAIEVRPVITYVPVSSAGQEQQEGTKMPQIDEAKLAELTAAAERVSKLETESAEKDRLIAERDKALKAHENSLLAGKALPTVEGFDKLPELAQARVAEHLSRNVPVNDAGDFDAEKFNTVAAAAIKSEADYLAKVSPASENLRGFGDSRPASESAPTRRTRDAWGDPIKTKKEN